MNKPRLPLIIAAINLICLFFDVTGAYPHVEGHMPNSVAEMEYKILLELKPKDVATRVKLGMILLNQGKLIEAEREFSKVLKYDHQNIQAHLGLSILSLKQNRTGKALKIIRKAAMLAPDRPSVFLNYGKILEADNRPDEALKMYVRGLKKISPGSEDANAEHEREELENARQKLKERLKKSAAD